MGHQFKFGDKVIDDVYGEGIVVVSKKSFCCVYFKDSGNVRFDISEIGDLKPVSDWIKIDWDDESTLPDLDKEYLACLPSGHIVVLKFTIDEEGYAVFVDDDNCIDVTHWQPLPQLPK